MKKRIFFSLEGNNTTMDFDTAFEMANSNIRFGTGVTREIGMDVKDRGLGRVMVLTDPHLCELPPVQTVLESLRVEGIDFELFDQVRVEPTDKSFLDAISFARLQPSKRISSIYFFSLVNFLISSEIGSIFSIMA